MPKITRQAVLLLPHRKRSGLFLTAEKEYVADLKPDDGSHVIRQFGADKACAIVLFDALLKELEASQTERENPTLIRFLEETFLPSQESLKSYAFANKRVKAIVRFLEAKCPRLRLSEVKRALVDDMRRFYPDVSARTHNGNSQKFKQALNFACDLDLLPANLLACVKPLKCDNRRWETLSLTDFARIVHEARNTDLQDVFAIGGLVGLRPSNVLALEKSEVDTDTGTLTLRGEKMKNG